MRDHDYSAIHPSARPKSWSEFQLRVRVVLALLKAQCLVWYLPTGKLVSPAAVGAGHVGRASMAPQRVAHITRRLFGAAERLPIRPVCLVRAVALARLLATAGHAEAIVCAGVRMRAGRFEGHAWVEYGGQPLGEDPAAIATFAPMASVHIKSFS